MQAAAVAVAVVASFGLFLVTEVAVEVRQPVAPPQQGRRLALPHSQVRLEEASPCAHCCCFSGMGCGLAFCPLLLPFVPWAVALPFAHCCCLSRHGLWPSMLRILCGTDPSLFLPFGN